MKIGVLADRIGTEAGGLESYESGLIRGLMQIDKDNRYIVYCSDENAVQSFCGSQENFSIKQVSGGSKVIRLALTMPFSLLKDRLDAFHVCMVPPVFSPTNYVMTVHDLCPFIKPELFPSHILRRLTLFLKKGIEKALHIITVSEATKRDIINCFGVDENKITVAHLGVNRQYKPVNDKEAIDHVIGKYGISRPYILYVGKIQARKNVIRLLQAFKYLKEKIRIEHKLVMVGKHMWESSNLADELDGKQDDIIMTGHADVADLPFLYNGADCFVYPSLFEGFGIPPLESMACGVPTVISNTTSLPEVAGDSSIYVDPLDITSISGGIERVLSSSELQQELRQKGLIRAAEFTWDKTAQKTLEVYRQLAKSKQ